VLKRKEGRRIEVDEERPGHRQGVGAARQDRHHDQDGRQPGVTEEHGREILEAVTQKERHDRQHRQRREVDRLGGTDAHVPL
jgi:hypothetical protein